MYNPVKLSEETKKIVCKNLERKYYRFRSAKFYGGISTADTVGCNLRCLFCWAWNVVTRPDKIGKFYSPKEVVEKLVSIARKKNYRQIRISGNEPTICKKHLLTVLKLIPNEFLFILETNGILIGYDESYARDLSKFKNLHVRVCLKGSNPEEFSKLTGAIPEAFGYQIKAIENLEKNKINYHPAIMTFTNDNSYIIDRLEKINQSLPSELEFESIIKYPGVVERLKKAGIKIE